MKKASSSCTGWLLFAILVLGYPGYAQEVADSSDLALFEAAMQKHLEAVATRDLAALRRTLPPDGKMQLILPGSEITHSTDEFIHYHRAWFQDTTWTFETKILNTEVGKQMGIAIVEAMYREPNRNGKPYFNRMSVSYALKNIDGQWYVIKDHASSVEKTTP